MESAEVTPCGGSRNHVAIIGGHVEKELLKRNEYLAAENEILRSKIKGRIKFTTDERRHLATFGNELGRKALAEIGPIVIAQQYQGYSLVVPCSGKPATIIAWYRKLIAEKFDSSKSPQRAGRPKKGKELAPFR